MGQSMIVSDIAERAPGLAGDAALPPDREQRAGDLVSGLAVGLVMGEIGGAPGAVILAGGVDAQRVPERRAISSPVPAPAGPRNVQCLMR